MTWSVRDGPQTALVREKPVVMPVLLGDEPKSVACKVYTSGPSMPAGTIVWVEIGERWLKARVLRIEFAALHLTVAFHAESADPLSRGGTEAEYVPSSRPH